MPASAPLSFRLSDFEGPLDLLLHLIAKHKLNILDIEISELLAQYLAFLDGREDKDLEVQSEFLEMAARLVHIKTVMLLPRHEEEADELKTELAGELMEYQVCRALAAKLYRMADENRVFVREPIEIGSDPTYMLTHPASVLPEALRGLSVKAVRRQPAPREAFSGIVSKRVVSVSSRIIHLLRRFYRTPRIGFDEAFSDQKGRSELVATFLALLELIKGGRVTVSEDGSEIVFHRERERRAGGV